MYFLLNYIQRSSTCFTLFTATIRLAHGPTEYDGIVEVYHNGEWGTVCDIGWDLNDAQVVCNQLGLDKVAAIRNYTFYRQNMSGRIWLSNLNCTGTELNITNCSHNGWGIESCSHSEDAGVHCFAGNL